MSSLSTSLRSVVLAAAVGLAGFGLAAAPVFAAEEVNVNDGYAVHGYDVVAYFVTGEPTEGDDAYTAEHAGASYRFASAENRDLFLADPEAYAPAYGGFCAFGTAMGRKFDGDPQAWAIVDDRLYLNVNQNVQKRWEGDPEGFIRGADNNWTIIRSVADADLEANPPTSISLGAQ